MSIEGSIVATYFKGTIDISVIIKRNGPSFTNPMSATAANYNPIYTVTNPYGHLLTVILQALTTLPN